MDKSDVLYKFIPDVPTEELNKMQAAMPDLGKELSIRSAQWLARQKAPLEYTGVALALVLFNVIKSAALTVAEKNPAASEILRRKIKEEAAKW